MKKLIVTENELTSLNIGELVTLENNLSKNLLLVRSERPEVRCLFGQYLQAIHIDNVEEY
jgi:hypothetical protein